MRHQNKNTIHPSTRIHQTAIIEEGVVIGPNTTVWDSVHIRRGAVVGQDCIIGEKTCIAYDVLIGNRVKINAFVYICTGVEIEDQVMISAGTVFTNEKLPRAFDLDGVSLRTSNPTGETLKTSVKKGTTIGANATIGPGLIIGEFSMVGMGSVVTRDILPHTLVYGNPARIRGFVCTCGQLLGKKLSPEVSDGKAHFICSRCSRSFTETGNTIMEVRDVF